MKKLLLIMAVFCTSALYAGAQTRVIVRTPVRRVVVTPVRRVVVRPAVTVVRPVGRKRAVIIKH
jgi:hypothetical protein